MFRPYVQIYSRWQARDKRFPFPSIQISRCGISSGPAGRRPGRPSHLAVSCISRWWIKLSRDWKLTKQNPPSQIPMLPSFLQGAPMASYYIVSTLFHNKITLLTYRVLGSVVASLLGSGNSSADKGESGEEGETHFDDVWIWGVKRKWL